MSVLDTTPLGTQAGIVDRVLSYPDSARRRLALPTIASNFDMTIVDLQTLLHHYGYPDPARMKVALERLTAAAQHAVADDTLPATQDPDGEIPTDTTQLRRVPLNDLHPDPGNLRSDLTGIEDLADSMRENGLHQPIVARRDGDRLVIVAGHRRYAAAKHLRWTDIEVVIRGAMKPDAVIAAMLIENGQRADLDPIDEARGMRQLKATHGYTDADLARKIGRSQGFVSTRLALLNLTPEEQEQVRNGELGRVEGSNLGRLKSGKTRPSSKGHVTVAHFGATHDLASKAAARCKRLAHRGKIAGGMACGSCWESVIRADERDHTQARNALVDDCVTCGHPLEKAAVPA